MQSLPRRWEGTLLLVLLVLCGTGRGRAAATDGTGAPRDQDTNVIMVSVDTLRHDHLGCYGYPRNTSPNIDRLAGQSVVFERYVSQAILTPVSQMSIFTAQYPRVNGVVSFQPAPDVMQSKTLAEILKAYGFVTAAFLGSPEFQDERYGGPPNGDRRPRGLFSRSFDVYERSRGGFRSVPEDALQWVRENKDSRFFLWLPIGTVHWPYSGSVPAPYRTQFDPPGYTPFFDTMLPGRRGGAARDAVHADVLSYIYKGRYYAETDRVYTLSDADREFIVARYDAGIFYADLFRVPRRTRSERLETLFRFSRLGPFQDRLAGALSGGMKQKLALACALVHSPRLLLLDEPTNGVDPVSRRDFWKILYELLKQGISILVSTAYLDEAERTNRVALMHRGSIIQMGEPQALKNMVEGVMLELVASDLTRSRELLDGLEGILDLNVFGDALHVRVREEETQSSIRQKLEQNGILVNSLRRIVPAMEDAFLSLIPKDTPSAP